MDDGVTYSAGLKNDEKFKSPLNLVYSRPRGLFLFFGRLGSVHTIENNPCSDSDCHKNGDESEGQQDFPAQLLLLRSVKKIAQGFLHGFLITILA